MADRTSKAPPKSVNLPQLPPYQTKMFNPPFRSFFEVSQILHGGAGQCLPYKRF